MFLQQYDQLVATQCLQHNKPKFYNRSTLFRASKSIGDIGYNLGFETAAMTIPEMVEQQRPIPPQVEEQFPVPPEVEEAIKKKREDAFEKVKKHQSDGQPGTSSQPTPDEFRDAAMHEAFQEACAAVQDGEAVSASTAQIFAKYREEKLKKDGKERVADLREQRMDALREQRIDETKVKREQQIQEARGQEAPIFQPGSLNEQREEEMMRDTVKAAMEEARDEQDDATAFVGQTRGADRSTASAVRGAPRPRSPGRKRSEEEEINELSKAFSNTAFTERTLHHFPNDAGPFQI